MGKYTSSGIKNFKSKVTGGVSKKSTGKANYDKKITIPKSSGLKNHKGRTT